MNTFQACPLWLLGSTLLFDPYQTASARPAPPALIHGNTFTASPVVVDALDARTGLDQTRQPDLADATETYVCHWPGRFPLMSQITNRFRAVSNGSTVNSV